jgi:glycosyltransferase involved in cell wall biosynthesis
MRICLLTGGGYPYRRDALGGWCRALVQGLSTATFELVTITDRETAGPPAYPLPANVASARAVVLPRDEHRRGAKHDDGLVAARLLCRGLLSPGVASPGVASPGVLVPGVFGTGVLNPGLLGTGPEATAMVIDGLRNLAEQAGPQRPAPATGPLAETLLDAWRVSRAAAPMPEQPALPRLSVRDARTAATLLRHALGALAVEVPESDLVHCVAGTAPLLAALGAHWRTGVPLLLTEARAPVLRHRPAEERLSPAVRLVLRSFRAAVLRAGYAEAGLIAPLSAYHHTWAMAHGAAPDKLVPVPAGVEPGEFPAVPVAEDRPAIVWAGSGGPDSGLKALLEAFAHIAAAAPAAVLHLVGVLAGHEDYAAELVDRAGLGRRIRLHPLPADPGDRYADGHVVVHLPGPADPPYRLVEAMMSGRAVVGADVGPTAEVLGDTGLLVPGNDPAALAAACLALLRSPERRQVLGDAARRRALALFTTDRFVRSYGALYADLAAVPPAGTVEMSLAIPAPRGGPAHSSLPWLSRKHE